MGYFFDTFYFEPVSRMTGIWQARSDLDADTELVALASHVQFGPDQHDELEADFFGSHLPFHFGGFHGVGPDGHPWAVMLQVAPASAASLVGSDTVYWPMLDGVDRALHHNWESSLLSDRGFTRAQLVDIYLESGVDASAVEDWDVPDLMLGLLAECCYVSLRQIVAGRLTQCAFPHMDHECQHDVFSDVFSMWMTGALSPPEPQVESYGADDPEFERRIARKKASASRVEYWWPKKKLRTMSTKELRELALACFWDPDQVEGLKRKKLITLLSTLHWRNAHDDAKRRTVSRRETRE